jgi:hypothetical protein
MVAVDGGNTFRQAKPVGTVALRPGALATLDIFDALTIGETADWFRFRVRGRASSGPGFSTTVGLTADSNVTSLTLYKESRKKPGRTLARLDPINSVKNIKGLSQGTYFIKIAGVPSAEPGSQGDYLSRIQVFTPSNSLFQ